MRFTWDAAKAARNLAMGRLGFPAAKAAFADPAFLVRPAKPGPDGEPHRIGFGRVEGILVAVGFTQRGDTTRLISARRAKRRERRQFEQATGEPADLPPPAGE